MMTTDHYTALILISAAQKLITDRRKLEKMCGYPPEYGNDEKLLQRINEFLGEQHIEHELKEALAFTRGQIQQEQDEKKKRKKKAKN
jgi:hypothetical protein